MAFFTVEPLTLMISSRSKDKVQYQGRPQVLTKVREAMKIELEKIVFGDEPVFKVWIHEPEAVLPADQSPWDHCMSRAREADIFLALYNGHAGGSGGGGLPGDHLGFCHAELATAYNKTPSKVRSVQFPAIKAKKGSPDERFQSYFLRQGMFGAQVETGEQAIACAKEAAVAALLDLARAGVGVGSKGSYYAGEALAWTRMDFKGRRQVTTDAVVEFLLKRSGSGIKTTLASTVIYRIDLRTTGDGVHDVAFVCDCIPASMGTAAARELVGQPFLADYQIASELPAGVGGPVHVIACQKGVSESQAIRQLGFPDAVVVSAPFGVYVADDVQKIQMVFIANCRDETTTRHRVQRFLQWLNEQGENRLLAKRAASRRKISDLIAAER